MSAVLSGSRTTASSDGQHPITALDHRPPLARFPFPKVDPQQQLAQQSPSPLQSQSSWETPFAMENYALRAQSVGHEGRTRSNSTVSASSMGGLMTLDGIPMPTKVCAWVPMP